jgi:hypothetical protein
LTVIEALLSELVNILSLQIRPYLFGEYFSINLTGYTCSIKSIDNPCSLDKNWISRVPSGILSSD